MRRLFHLLIVSGMVFGMLLVGATSAFATEGDDGILGGDDDGLEDLICEALETLGLEDDNGNGDLLGDLGLNGDENGNGDLLGDLGLDGDDVDLLILDLDCDDDVVPVVTPPAAPVTPVPPVGHVGDVGGAQVSSVPSGGVATGGGTAPVGATALIVTLLAMVAVGTGLGRALARS